MDHRDRANLFVCPRTYPQRRVDPDRLPPGKGEARAALGPALRVEGERGCWRTSEGWVTREAVWEAFVGPVAPGMRLFARCQCLRPEHAEHIRHPPEGSVRRGPYFLGTYWSLWEIEHKIAGMRTRDGCLVRGNGGTPLLVPPHYQVSYGPRRISIKHAAWSLQNPDKPLPPLHSLLRTCNTPGCCNPEHITYNPLLAEPRPLKQPRGKKGRKARLTPRQAEEAFEMRQRGVLLREIAERFGVSIATARRYTLGAEEEADPSHIAEARKMRRAGKPIRAIANRLGVSLWTARKYANAPPWQGPPPAITPEVLADALEWGSNINMMAQYHGVAPSMLRRAMEKGLTPPPPPDTV